MKIAGAFVVAALLYAGGALSAQIAHVGPVATVTGTGSLLRMITDLRKSLAFYNGVLGFKIQRQPRGPASDPAAYIKVLPNVAPIYLIADEGEYRSAELSLGTPPVGLELEDFKGQAPKAVHPRLVDPGATVLKLWVKDVADVLKRVAPADVVTADRKPVAVRMDGGRANVLFVRDPDGWLVEFIQPDPLPAAALSAEQNVFASGVAISVNDIGDAVRFYRDTLGFDVSQDADFAADDALLKAAGVGGVRVRRARTTIPRTSFPVEFMEFKGLERKAVFPEVHDPGATMMRLSVVDLPTVMKNLRNAGIPINSRTGEPYNNVVIVKAPDALFLQLRSAPQATGTPQ
jgi:catechol 2,3-dioxygenase-like lactoylglutathione lyase family enzyme